MVFNWLRPVESALYRTGLDPENAISWGQINAADAIPLEAIPGYIASEAAVRHKILVEFFSEFKDIKVKFLKLISFFFLVSFVLQRIWRRISATLRASTVLFCFVLTEKVVGNGRTSVIRMSRGRKRCLQV